MKYVQNIAVNDEYDEQDIEDEDDGYNSLISAVDSERKNRGRSKFYAETLIALDDNTKVELTEKILILKEAYDDLKGENQTERLSESSKECIQMI